MRQQLFSLFIPPTLELGSATIVSRTNQSKIRKLVFDINAVYKHKSFFFLQNFYKFPKITSTCTFLDFFTKMSVFKFFLQIKSRLRKFLLFFILKDVSVNFDSVYNFYYDELAGLRQGKSRDSILLSDWLFTCFTRGPNTFLFIEMSLDLLLIMPHCT